VDDSSELGTMKPSITSNNVASRNYRLDGKEGKTQVFSAVQVRSRSGRQGGCCHGVHGVLCNRNVSAKIVLVSNLALVVRDLRAYPTQTVSK